MRWYKKAAAVLLAAAMAVSMMTACGTTGGGNGGNGGNNGSKPGTSEGSGNGGNGGNNGSKPGTSEGGDEKPDKPGASVIPADPAKVTWDTSLTKKCYNAVSADDFKVSGLLGGGAFGYATQGKKQFVVNQEDQNTMIAFYTPDGESLYLTSYKLTADTTDTTVNDLTWTSIEEYGKSEGASDEKIAKEKQGILEELKETKNLIYIANKVVPLTFSAENYTNPFAQEFYRESIKANVDGVVYTYEFYYAAKDMADGNGKVVYKNKKGDMTRICRVNDDTSTLLFVSTQLSRCDAKMFPKVN